MLQFPDIFINSDVVKRWSSSAREITFQRSKAYMNSINYYIEKEVPQGCKLHVGETKIYHRAVYGGIRLKYLLKKKTLILETKNQTHIIGRHEER